MQNKLIMFGFILARKSVLINKLKWEFSLGRQEKGYIIIVRAETMKNT